MKVIILMCVLYCFHSFGQSMNTDRPAYSLSAQGVRKGVFQLEAGLQLNNFAIGNDATSILQAPTAQFRIGLSNRIELRVQNGLNFRRGTKNRLKAAMDNFEMGLKWNVLNRKKVNISTVFQGIIPTGSGELQKEEVGGRFIVAVDHKLKKSGRIGYNLGSKLSSIDEEDAHLQAYYTLFYEHRMNSNLSIFAEAYHLFKELGEFEQFDVDFMELNIDFGLTYVLKNNMQLDYSFGFGLLERMNFHALGISYRLQPNAKRRMY